MASDAKGLIRPRTTGEILDDAIRLYVADAPLLLALSGLFLVPACLAFLLMLTQPATLPNRLLWPALCAVLFPLTGLGCGACQEVFRRRSEEQPVSLGACLRAAGRRALGHLTARGLVLGVSVLGAATMAGASLLVTYGAITAHPALGVLLGAACLALSGLLIWSSSGCVHPVLAAGEGQFFAGLGAAARDVQRQAGKAMLLTLTRLILFVFGALTLLLLINNAMAVASSIAGLDVAFWDTQLAVANPVYLLAVLMIVWLMLAPFTEASNYLLHVDSRARYEGLDLWYRVKRYFPTSPPARVGALLLALGAGLLLPGMACAAPDQLTVVQEVRQRVEKLRDADPYPGNDRCQRELRRLAPRLDPTGSATTGDYQWFYREADGFHPRDREQAVQLLDRLVQRLKLEEKTLKPPQGGKTLTRDQIKNLAPSGEPDDDEAQKTTVDKKEEEKEPVQRDEDDDSGRGGRRSKSGAIESQSVGGFGQVGWGMLLALLVAVVVVVAVLLWRNRGTRRVKPRIASGKKEVSADDLLRQPEPKTAAVLWRQADDLARQGRFLEALRLLYLGVLAILHRANLIRYESTRTNGEYTEQLRHSAPPPSSVPEPFQRLTNLFEWKWYGERNCESADYNNCRTLAEEVRTGAEA